MKKLLALLLALSMVLCFAACADDTKDNKDNDKDKDSETTTVAAADDTTAGADDETTEAPDEKTTEAPDEKTTEAPDEKTTEAPEEETTKAPATGSASITRGSFDGNVYENESAGIRFTKPDSWVYATDEEIAEAMQLGADIMDYSEFEMALASQGSLTDMMLRDTATGSSVTVVFENLALSNAKNITEEEYFTALETQLSGAAGMTVEKKGDFTKVNLGSREYTSALYTVTANGIEMEMACYIAKLDTHMCVISVSSVLTELSEIEAMFG